MSVGYAKSMCGCRAIGANNILRCKAFTDAVGCEKNYGRCEWGPSYNKKCYAEALAVEKALNESYEENLKDAFSHDPANPHLLGLA
jgi:hypothetical protein